MSIFLVSLACCCNRGKNHATDEDSCAFWSKGMFVWRSKTSLLGTTIVGLFDNMGKVWYFNYVMIRNVAF